jgi:hypothetical protein
MLLTMVLDPVIVLPCLAWATPVKVLGGRTMVAALLGLGAWWTTGGGAGQTWDAMEVSSFSVGLADGRSLEVSVSGPEQATPLVIHHGTPSDRTQYRPFAEAAAVRELRLVSYSRPGYGGSSRQPGRTIADCAADSLAIVEQLGAGRFYTAGWSGAVRMCWPAPCCCPTGCWLAPPSPAWGRSALAGWSSLRGWVKRTTRSLVRRWLGVQAAGLPGAPSPGVHRAHWGAGGGSAWRSGLTGRRRRAHR